jgi:signal transduction histidine kinase/ligand-binding sensor domain-containing protein/CheY-like chemotaxis protein
MIAGKIRIPLVVGVAFLAASAVGRADEPPMVFSHVTADEGLSQNTVMSILQDSQGFIWLGTEAGLNRYDGYDVHEYARERDKPQGLASDYVWAIREDSRGNLWLATDGGGVAVWDRRSDSFRSYRHDPKNPQSLSSDAIRNLLIDHRGQVWVATRDKGLNMIDPATGRVTRFAHDGARPDSLGSNTLFALLEDRDGALWVSGDAGVDRYPGSNGAFEHYQPPTAGGDQRSILALAQDSRGDLWLGSFGGGLFRLDTHRKRFTAFKHSANDERSLSNDDVRAIFEDADKRLWIGTANGLNLFDAPTGTFQSYHRDRSDAHSLSDDNVMAIYQDRGGMLWLGTRGGGASLWNPRSWSLGHQLPTVLKDGASVSAFAEDLRGGLWIGALGAGLFRQAQGARELVPLAQFVRGPQRLADDRITSLLVDRTDQLWIGTMSGGLSRLSKDGTLAAFHAGASGGAGIGADGVMSLYEDQGGRIWIGTFGGGISAYDPETRTFRRYADESGTAPWLANVRATAFAEDDNGYIWAGTDGDGLLLLDANRGLLRRYRHDAGERTSISADTVYTVHLDSAHRLWVGTAGGGLNRIDGNSRNADSIRFASLSTVDGLPSNVIYGVEHDATGALWLSTSRGLARLNPELGAIKTFHANHGAQAEEFNFGAHLRSRAGELLFGGNNGYNAFDPRRLQEGTVPPPVVVTRVEVLNQTVSGSGIAGQPDHLDLGYRQNAVSFEFAALDFADSRRNQYAYKLEGFDADWIHLGDRRRVSYTNLPAGNYVLKVRGASAESVWNETALDLPLSVRPAPWLTGWAIAAYAIAALTLLSVVLRNQRERQRREERYTRRLENDVANRTEELNERNRQLAEANAAKSSFLARMSHEIRTPMNGVIGMTELLRGTDLNSQQGHYAQTISRSAQALLQIINDILDLSKIEAGRLEMESIAFDLEEVVDDCIGLLAPQANKKGVELVVAIAPNVPRSLIGDPLRIRQVLMNLIGNALKFTAEGEVAVRAELRQSNGGLALVRLEVRDTGAGIEEAGLARLFEPFSQADESTTRRYGGTGLGLSICKHLVELMGGTIGASSQMNVGSTFWCEIPFPVGANAAAEASREFSGLHVAIATPIRSLQNALAERLASCGARPTRIDSTSELEEFLAQGGACDILLLDSDRLSRVNFPTIEAGAAGPDAMARIFLSRQARPMENMTMMMRDRDAFIAKPLSWRTLRLAILDAMAQAAKPAREPDNPVAGASDCALGMRVLIAEDNPVNQLVAEGMLHRLGCQTRIVADGRSAVAAATTEHFDVVLMDAQMPVMDGFEATRLIRSSENTTPQLPIIGLTAHASNEAREVCLAAGMDDFLSKPYTLQNLRAALERTLKKARQGYPDSVARRAAGG